MRSPFRYGRERDDRVTTPGSYFGKARQDTRQDTRQDARQDTRQDTRHVTRQDTEQDRVTQGRVTQDNTVTHEFSRVLLKLCHTSIGGGSLPDDGREVGVIFIIPAFRI
jgi:hypothetical protein